MRWRPPAHHLLGILLMWQLFLAVKDGKDVVLRVVAAGVLMSAR